MTKDTVIKVALLGAAVQTIGGIMFISSFFVEDNKKAVKRRWHSAGIFAIGLGMQYGVTYIANKFV